MTHKLRRTPLVAAAAFLACLVVPAAAQAHHVESEASCVLVDNQPTITLTADFVGFTGTQAVTGTVSVDGVQRFNGAVPVTWSGSNGTWTYTIPGTAGTSHTVTTTWSWPTNQNDGETHTINPCPTPPTPPPPPTPPDTPPPSTPPATPPPGGTPPETTPPAGGTLPEEVVSGRAVLRGPSGCVKQAFKARVRGRSISSVTFFVDGRQVKRISGERAVYRLSVNPERYGFGRHRITARVRFSEESGTPARTLPLTFRRCAQGTVAPRFTG